MEAALIIAIISALGSVIAAVTSYYFSRKREIEADWRNQKLTAYKELLAGLSDAAIGGINDIAAQERFANSFNTIALVAPQPVIERLLEFHDEIRIGNSSPLPGRHDAVLANLLLEIRKDLQVKPGDNVATFRFRLIGKPVHLQP